MKQHAPSLSRRLFFSALFFIAAGLTVSGIILSFAFERSVRQVFEEGLAAQLRAVTGALDIDDEGKLVVASALDDVRYDQVFSGWYWQISTTDDALIRSRSLWDQQLSVPVSPTPGAITFYDLAGPRSQNVRAAVTIVNRGRFQGVTIIAAIDSAGLTTELGRFNLIVFVALGILGIGLVGAAVLQVTVGLRPLKVLADELVEIGDGARAELSDKHPREVAPLVGAFNAVRKNDQETLARTRREIGNLAHALKTPLARLKVEAERTRSDLSRNLSPYIDHLRGKIDFYAARAATSGLRGAGVRKINVEVVVTDILSALKRIYADKRVTINTDFAPNTTVLGEEEDITEVIGNLIDNAFKWCRSAVHVTTFTGRDGFIHIVIDDDGNGIPTESMTEVIRGLRLDSEMPGSGLGLSIVDNIIMAYGGSLALEQSPLGGLRIVARLPFRTGAGDVQA